LRILRIILCRLGAGPGGPAVASQSRQRCCPCADLPAAAVAVNMSRKKAATNGRPGGGRWTLFASAADLVKLNMPAPTGRSARGRPLKPPPDLRVNSPGTEIALRQFSKHSLAEIPAGVRTEIIKLFASWSRHDKKIVLDDSDWQVLDDERGRYLEGLVMAMKCPPLDFLIALLSPDFDRHGEAERELRRNTAAGWRDNLLRSGEAWHRQPQEDTNRVTPFGVLVRRLAFFSYRKGFEPDEITAAVSYVPEAPISPFVSFVAAILSTVPLNQIEPRRSWPAFSKRVSRELSDYHLPPPRTFRIGAAKRQKSHRTRPRRIASPNVL
jgi:hypothetical protein